MKLWQKAYTVDQQIDRFTVGRDRELDLWLAPYDILGSIAHSKMLCHIGLMEQEELAQLEAALKRLYQKAIDGDFTIEEGVEDVHSQVEFLLTQELGDIGKKIHSGRSRNDQVLVDLRLYLRAEIQVIAESVGALFQQLTQLAETHKEELMPGYTHMQVAMVSSFGLVVWGLCRIPGG